MNTKKILVVEDEGIVARDIQNRLKLLGYSVPAIALTGEDAIKKTKKHRPDLILMDIMLTGDMDGIEAAARIRNHFNIPIIYLTAYSDENTLARAKVTDPYNYILKPFDDDDLRIGIDLAFNKHKSEKELRDREQWLRIILASISSAVIATDTKGFTIFMNPLAESLTGWHQNEVFGKAVEDIFICENGDPDVSIGDQVLRVIRSANTESIVRGSRLIDRAGSEKMIEGSYAPIKFEDGEIIGAMIVFNAVSKKKLSEGYADPKRRAVPTHAQTDRTQAEVPIAGWSSEYEDIRDQLYKHDISDFVRMLAIAPVAKEGSRNWVQTFNDFRVKLDGVELNLTTWRSKKAVDLLAYMILRFPQSVHKEVLIEYLWPEVEPEVGSRRLHHVVSELRRYLEPSATRYAREQYLLYDHGEYKLSLQGKVVINHVIFEEVVRAGNRLWSRDDFEGATRLYQEALQWKRGDLFPKYMYERDFEGKRDLLNKLEEIIHQRIGDNRLV